MANRVKGGVTGRIGSQSGQSHVRPHSSLGGVQCELGLMLGYVPRAGVGWRMAHRYMCGPLELPLVQTQVRQQYQVKGAQEWRM